MEALEQLQMQGRKIGVISHVQEMSERISVQVQVHKKSEWKKCAYRGGVSTLLFSMNYSGWILFYINSFSSLKFFFDFVDTI